MKKRIKRNGLHYINHIRNKKKYAKMGANLLKSYLELYELIETTRISQFKSK